MKVITGIEQGTAAWLALRLGIPTASNADKLVTPTGNATGDTTSERYLYELFTERVTGAPAVEAPKLWWAERGKELEEQARTGYEFKRDAEVVPVSFITDDLGRYGCSPDGRVGPTGLVEFKAGNCAEHVAILKKSGVAFKKHGIQCQYQLFTADECEYVDLSSYYPGLPQAIVRIERVEKYQKVIREENDKFLERLEALTEEAIREGWSVQWGKQVAPRKDSLVDALKQSLIEVNKQ